MMDLADFYQDVILDHCRKPRNYGQCPQANRHAAGYNPLCGDHIEVWAQLNGSQIQDIHFSGSACAICTASASMMTQSVKGKAVEEANVLFDQIRHMLTGPDGGDTDHSALGKLAALAGVRRYSMRVKCATLPWHTLKATLEQSERPATTE